MTAILANQLVIARQALEEQRRKSEEEYQKDLEALERVARFLPTVSAPSKVHGAQVPTKAPSLLKAQSAEEEERSYDSQTPSLISTVLETILSRPNAALSPR